MQRLDSRGYTDIAVSSQRRDPASIRVSNTGLALFFRQLSVMLESGTQLSTALNLSSFTEDRLLSGVVMSVGDQVAAGKSLSTAMASFPGVFDTLIVGLISAAERSGQLSTTLARIADAEERHVNLQSQLASALAYPVFLTASTLVMCGLFVFYILPMDQELFGSLGIELPSVTQFLVGLINLAKSPLGILGGLAIFSLLLAVLRDTAARRRARQRFVETLRKFRLTRTIIDKARAARMLQVMSLLLRGGSTMDVALKFMMAASDDERQRRLLGEIREEIRRGEELSEALYKNDLFPRLVIALLVIGYEAGFLEEMCGKAADMCEEDVRLALDAATALVEPLLMGFAGVVGGFVIISSALPLLKLVEGL